MNKRAQGILEYIFLIIVIIAALLIIGYYVRNSLAGKMREGADTFGQGEVYLPFVTTVDSGSSGGGSGSGGGGSGGGGSCLPVSCASLGKNCGSLPDGCGGTLNCGNCFFPMQCQNNVCVGIVF